MELIKPGREFDFMGTRLYFIGLSMVLVLASLFAIFVYPKPNLGTDFVGGTEVEIVFSKAIEPGAVRTAVEEAGFSSPDVVVVTDSTFENHFLIRVQEVSTISEAVQEQLRGTLCLPHDGAPMPADCPPELQPTEIKFSPGGDKIVLRYEKEPNIPEIRKRFQAGSQGLELRAGENDVTYANQRVELHLKSKGEQLMEGLQKRLGADVVPASPIRIEWIGPKAGAQLRDAAIKSIVIALFFIMVYIAFRFDMRFAPGGIVALLHDVTIAMGALVITGRDVNLTTVAAMLTIVGYSINDTVVVFDRIRENLGKHRGMSLSRIINLSVSEMLGRTIITNGLTMISLTSFLYFGTGVIKDFAFAIIVGILVGTYSSIYMAAPVTEWVDRRFFGAKTSAGRKIRRTRAQKRAETVV